MAVLTARLAEVKRMHLQGGAVLEDIPLSVGLLKFMRQG